jgi:hypothetical protein
MRVEGQREKREGAGQRKEKGACDCSGRAE